jgi:hypothetical protein
MSFAVRRAAAAACAVLVAGGLAACTGASSDSASDTPSASAPRATGSAATGAGGAADPASAGPTQASPGATTPRVPDSATTVVDGGGLAERSVALSAQLLASAPVAVVAVSNDAAGVDDGARHAAELGAPLLLLRAAPGGTADEPAEAEIVRLGAEAVLAVGPEALERLEGRTDAEVVTEPADLPPTQPPAEDPAVTVLVRADARGGAQRAATMATGTARAAGARVIGVRGGDPRADSETIAALSESPPQHVVAVGAFGPAQRLEQRIAVASTGVELPGGGQVMFPGRRLVALYGHPGTGALGVLGEQGLNASIRRAKEHAARYDDLSDVPVVPAFEIIATVAHAAPGRDGDYSSESTVAELQPWVRRAGERGVYVILDLQPGRADLLDQARLYEPLLKLPHVGLALDPEWKLKRGQRPLQQIGSVDAKEINRVSTWLADLTARERLPQKLLVLHQFKLSMLGNAQDIDTSRDELAMLVHMDGQGAPSLKDGTWRAILPAAPDGLEWWGWKNFYDEDSPMMTPRETMAKRPQPVMISYQ